MALTHLMKSKTSLLHSTSRSVYELSFAETQCTTCLSLQQIIDNGKLAEKLAGKLNPPKKPLSSRVVIDLTNSVDSKTNQTLSSSTTKRSVNGLRKVNGAGTDKENRVSGSGAARQAASVVAQKKPGEGHKTLVHRAIGSSGRTGRPPVLEKKTEPVVSSGESDQETPFPAVKPSVKPITISCATTSARDTSTAPAKPVSATAVTVTNAPQASVKPTPAPSSKAPPSKAPPTSTSATHMSHPTATTAVTSAPTPPPKAHASTAPPASTFSASRVAKKGSLPVACVAPRSVSTHPSDKKQPAKANTTKITVHATSSVSSRTVITNLDTKADPTLVKKGPVCWSRGSTSSHYSSQAASFDLVKRPPSARVVLPPPPPPPSYSFPAQSHLHPYPSNSYTYCGTTPSYYQQHYKQQYPLPNLQDKRGQYPPTHPQDRRVQYPPTHPQDRRGQYPPTYPQDLRVQYFPPDPRAGKLLTQLGPSSHHRNVYYQQHY